MQRFQCNENHKHNAMQHNIAKHNSINENTKISLGNLWQKPPCKIALILTDLILTFNILVDFIGRVKMD